MKSDDEIQEKLGELIEAHYDNYHETTYQDLIKGIQWVIEDDRTLAELAEDHGVETTEVEDNE